MVIYLIFCPQSGKGYIGQTIRGVHDRWIRHRRDAINGSPTPFHRAIIKYGEDAFEFSVLATASTIDELNVLEKHYIKVQNTLVPNGYNLQSGGNGYEVMEETRVKQSLTSSGRKHSAETKAKISAAQKGKPRKTGHRHSEETKAQMSASAKGLRNALGAVRSPEYRANMSAIKKLYWVAQRDKQ